MSGAEDSTTAAAPAEDPAPASGPPTTASEATAPQQPVAASTDAPVETAIENAGRTAEDNTDGSSARPKTAAQQAYDKVEAEVAESENQGFFDKVIGILF